MAALTWLLIPVAAMVLGVMWACWSTRERSTVGDAAGVAAFERFRSAMERSLEDTVVMSAVARATSDGSARAAD